MAASIISYNLAAAPLRQSTKKGPPPTEGPGSPLVHFYKLHCRKIVPTQNDLIVTETELSARVTLYLRMLPHVVRLCCGNSLLRTKRRSWRWQLFTHRS